MDTLFKTLLAVHIIGGVIGLFTGTMNLARRKGDKRHRLVGKVFVYAMLTAGFSSLVLSVLHPNSFLFIIGIFTIYLVGTGYRFLYLKLLGSQENPRGQQPKLADWVITIGMLITGIIFIGTGVKQLVSSNNFGFVYVVFGSLGLRFVKTDFDNYKGKSRNKNYWLLAHLQRMTGAYIASVTAFLVVNAKYSPLELPSLVFWLLPTAILTPLIISWSRKYKVKSTVV